MISISISPWLNLSREILKTIKSAVCQQQAAVEVFVCNTVMIS
jgi:hypothetical protein